MKRVCFQSYDTPYMLALPLFLVVIMHLLVPCFSAFLLPTISLANAIPQTIHTLLHANKLVVSLSSFPPPTNLSKLATNRVVSVPTLAPSIAYNPHPPRSLITVTPFPLFVHEYPHVLHTIALFSRFLLHVQMTATRCLYTSTFLSMVTPFSLI